MARILFTVPPLTGHLNPALAVAAALAASGHEIAWAVHATQIADKLPAGARVYTLDEAGAAPDLALPAARGLDSVRLFFEAYVLPMASRALATLEAAVRNFRPDVMVVDHQMLAGALVARKMGLKWSTLVTTTASIQSASPVIDDWVAAQYATLQAAYVPEGLWAMRPDFSPYLNVVCSIAALMGGTRPLMTAPYLFVGPVHGGRRPAVDFPWDWLQVEKQTILVTLGTVSRDRDTRFFDVMMAAIARLPDIQAVLVAPPHLAAHAPENVLVRNYVPQLALLDRASAVICHAGHNTVCEALSRGLPLIVAPIRDDQPVIARQVIDAGAGLFMRHGKVTPDTARATIDTLLATPALAERARALGQALRAALGAAGAASAIAALAA
jgi:MGT family glycosyltransferase